MNNIKSFVLYNEIFKLIDTIKPTSKRDEFLGKLLDFYFKDKKPKINLNSYEEIIWENISKPIISYKTKVINGSKGGRPKKTETITESKSESKTTSDVYVSNYDSNYVVNVNNKRFIKPSIEEIENYCKERNNKINASAFYDFYESKGWKVGNQSMKNWKACIRTWEQRNKKQEKVPKWFDKEIQEDSKENIELKELLKNYE